MTKTTIVLGAFVAAAAGAAVSTFFYNRRGRTRVTAASKDCEEETTDTAVEEPEVEPEPAEPDPKDGIPRLEDD